jgi:large repetitive protein
MVASISVNGPEAPGIVYDAGRAEAFVTEATSDTVAIIPRNLSSQLAVVPSRVAADVGQPVVWTTTSIAEPPAYSYAYTAPSGLGCAISTGPFVTCTPWAAGNYTLAVRIADPLGGSGASTSALVRTYSALTVNLTLSNATLWLGDTLAISEGARGGLPPYVYNFSNLPPGCVATGRPQIGCLPTEADNYTVEALVHDGNNWTETAAASLSVTFDFIILSPANATSGQSIVIRVDAAPGFGGLHYGFSGLPPGPGCVSQDVSALTCTPTVPGNYSIGVSVSDSAGDRARHTFELRVTERATTPTAPAGFLGLPGNEGYALVAGVGLVVVAAVAVGLLRRRDRRRPSPGAT